MVDNAASEIRLTGKVAVEALTPSNLIFSKDFRKSHVDFAVARAASLVTAVIGFIAFAPLFGLIALAIKLDSPGPIFFVQQRAGRYGRAFALIKFRTQLTGPEASGGRGLCMKTARDIIDSTFRAMYRDARTLDYEAVFGMNAPITTDPSRPRATRSFLSRSPTGRT